jgi:hypothetical protein
VQFSLRQLMLLITSLAILAALFRVSPKQTSIATAHGAGGAVAIALGWRLKLPPAQRRQGRILGRSSAFVGYFLLLIGCIEAVACLAVLVSVIFGSIR